ATNDFDDIYDYWAVLYDKKLIAYSMVALYGNDEANISEVKSIPDYNKYYPSNALFYTMNKHYLTNRSVTRINAGFRNIHHKTNIHNFLQKKLLFNKVSMHLGVFYNQVFSCFMKITCPFSGILAKATPKLEALYMLEKLRKKCASELRNR
ncbi:MAG: hypothetical protein WAL29_16385, partial [Bacteroidales bacterium]